jgi:hypothetical protein
LSLTAFDVALERDFIQRSSRIQRLPKGPLPCLRDTKGIPMKKAVRSIEEPEQKAPRADRPPTEGFVVIVDGHFKSEFHTAEAAEESGRALKATYPMLQIEIYDAATKARTLLS